MKKNLFHLVLSFAMAVPLSAWPQSPTTYFDAGGERIPMMRVPTGEIKSPAIKNIVEVQNELENFHAQYLRGERIRHTATNLKTLFTVISVKDGNWELDDYRAELDFYGRYDRGLAEKEREASRAVFVRKEWVHDSTMQAQLRERIAAESLFKAEMARKQ